MKIVGGSNTKQVNCLTFNVVSLMLETKNKQKNPKNYELKYNQCCKLLV